MVHDETLKSIHVASRNNLRKRGQTGMVDHPRLEASKDFKEERLLKAFWRESRICYMEQAGHPGLKFRWAQSEYYAKPSPWRSWNDPG